mmetsp:Transcript_8869/g.13013  ORF Transcript_8869/g.13013 Transcript_8869/m.13013 type:complete len:308 (+) Transcript_8869:81-1004(+)
MKFAIAHIALLSCLLVCANAFTQAPTGSTRLSLMKRAVIPAGQDPVAFGEATPEQRQRFENLFQDVLTCEVREHLPSILTKNIQLLVELRGASGVSLFQEQLTKAAESSEEGMIEKAEAAVEYIVYFAETFVSEAKNVDDKNKQLLGKIIKCMTCGTDEGKLDLEKQEDLDALMKDETDNFTPGFLRHLDGECERIANARAMTKESAKLLEVLRMIQTRVLEELGQHLGEGAQVLGQLLGYECSNERLGVLDAGLQVRGVDFAKELKAMTAEALAGFANVPGGVEQGLIDIIQEMDQRIAEFVEANE